MRNRFETFVGSVLELNRCVQRVKDAEMRPYGLKGSHVMCLYYLGQVEEGLTATKLTELCREDKAAISRCLSQLAERGYVRGLPPGQRRSYRMLHTLTEEGRQVAQEMNERIAAALFAGGQGLTHEQREVFYDAMERILTNLTRTLETKLGTVQPVGTEPTDSTEPTDNTEEEATV